MLQCDWLVTCQQSLRSEGSLCVNVQTLALSSSVVNGQLTRDCQGVTQLRFTSPATIF